MEAERTGQIGWKAGKLLGKIWRGSIWILCMGWNVCCVGTSLIIGFFGLLSLFGLGVLSVLLLQGYPLIGVMLGCLGAALCLFSLTGFCLTLLWKSGTKTEKTVEMEGKLNE